MADVSGEASLYVRTPIVQAADWVGLCSLGGTTCVLAYKLLMFKPPADNLAGKNKTTMYYFGYNEKGMLSLYVNLIAAVAYWAKMAMHVAGDPESDYNLTYYSYFDYMLTCPLLTLDLLWTLNLPYKVTYSLFVFLTLFSGFIAAGHPQPGKWMWFTYGMIIFAITWLRIVGLVQVRFMQYFAKKEKSMLDTGEAKNKRMSIAERAGFRKKNVRNPLQFALTVYFTIWIIYPVLWLLVEGGMISLIVNHCCTVVMDVLAKSMYGFALLKFQLLIDKSQVEFSELKVTKAELMEEYMEEKKKVRKMIKEMDEKEMEARDSDDDDEYNYPENASSVGGKKKRRGSQASSPALSHQLPSPQMVPMMMPGMPPAPVYNPAMAGAFPMTSMPPMNSPKMYEPPAGMAQSMGPMMPRASPTNLGGQGSQGKNWRSM